MLFHVEVLFRTLESNEHFNIRGMLISVCSQPQAATSSSKNIFATSAKIKQNSSELNDTMRPTIVPSCRTFMTIQKKAVARIEIFFDSIRHSKKMISCDHFWNMLRPNPYVFQCSRSFWQLQMRHLKKSEMRQFDRLQTGSFLTQLAFSLSEASANMSR